MVLFKVHWVEITWVCVKITFFSIKTVISPNLPKRISVASTNVSITQNIDLQSRLESSSVRLIEGIGLSKMICESTLVWNEESLGLVTIYLRTKSN